MQVLLDTKTEYIDHLLDIITIPLAKKIYKMYDASNGNIKVFQQNLVEIKNWNNNKIYDEYQLLLKKTKCNYFDKLLKEIVMLNIKIKTENASKIKDISIIKSYDFIHRCMINVSIFCWKNVYLFSSKNLKPSEKQYHLNLIEKNIRKILKNTIRDITPFETILELYNEKGGNKMIESDTEEEETSEEEEEEETSEDDEEETSEGDEEEETSEDEEETSEVKTPKIKIIEPEKIEVIGKPKKEIIKTPRINIKKSDDELIITPRINTEPQKELIITPRINTEPQEELNGAQEELNDTQQEHNDTQQEPNDTQEEPNDTQQEPNDTQEEPNDTQEELNEEHEELIEPEKERTITPRINTEAEKEDNETDEENYINMNLVNNIKKKTNRVLIINSDDDSNSGSDSDNIVEKDDNIKKINIKGMRKSRYY